MRFFQSVQLVRVVDLFHPNEELKQPGRYHLRKGDKMKYQHDKAKAGARPELLAVDRETERFIVDIHRH